MSVKPGQRLSRYRLEESIGMGGMGVVWRAADTSLGRRVAIKILPAGFAADRAKVTRFRREAKLLASLNHPNIATIHEIGEEGGVLFIAMELVEGETLRARLKRGALQVEETVRIGVEIAQALAYAHAAQVIHRDLKPDNVIVRPDGHPKVLDFGLARHLAPAMPGAGAPDESSGAATLTEHMTGEGWVVGTAGYMSPEQVRGEELDHRSDIFSFGILLYEMLAGAPPFRGRTKMDTLAAILERPARPIHEVRPQVPRDLALCLERCLEKEPAGRHRETGELARELARIHRGSDSVPTERARPLSVHGPPPPASAAAHQTSQGRARRFRPRHHLAVMITTAALLAAGFFLLPEELNPPPGEAPAPAEEPVEPAGAPARAGDRRIVVLPFENLGEPADAHFAAGMADEITTRLASVGDLHVIATASAAEYAGGAAPVSRVREELGVDYILEGKIGWASGGAGGIRVTPKLIDARDGSVVWAGIFNESIEDVFSVQSGIATTVIEHLGVALGEGEKEAVESVPTSDMEAYEAYLSGRFLRMRTDYSRPGRRRVVERFQRAVELDPGFALAWSELARAHAFMYHMGYDRSDERDWKARLAAERARALAPGQPETHLGLGYYHYHVERSYDAALREFSLAREGMPGSVDVLMAIAYVERRQGRFQESADLMARAADLSPREPGLLSQLGNTLIFIDRFQEAEAALRRAIALAPRESYPYLMLSWLHLKQGDLQGSRAALEAFTAPVDPPIRHNWYLQHLLEGDPRAALEWVGPQAPEIIEWGAYFYPRDLLEGYARRLLGQRQRARSLFESALATLRAEEAASSPDPRLRLGLGLALALTGRSEEAMREARAGVDLNPPSRDAYFSPETLMQLAWVGAVAGDKEAALETLRRVAAMPHAVHLALLDRDPRFAPLWDEPRFQALVKEARAAAE